MLIHKKFTKVTLADWLDLDSGFAKSCSGSLFVVAVIVACHGPLIMKTEKQSRRGIVARIGLIQHYIHRDETQYTYFISLLRNMYFIAFLMNNDVKFTYFVNMRTMRVRTCI